MGQNGMQQTKSRFVASKQHSSSTPRLGKIDCSNLSAHLRVLQIRASSLGSAGRKVGRVAEFETLAAIVFQNLQTEECVGST